MNAQIAHAIIGTAGHIDHGKTALVKALTGQDTDRLKEEKERGISIDLGFAYFRLADGRRVGIVDVPGHERFIRNMLAGAHGIDLALVVVAANDGVMPQTEEHLDILHLLGLRRGIFVVTKADLVDARRLAEVSEEIAVVAEGTRLEGAPVLAVSSVTGAGLEELRAAIVRELAQLGPPRQGGFFRLPLDRVFVMKGHGTVVTGTAMGAEVRTGQRLRVMRGGAEVRVRSIQVHSESVESAGAAQRVALNLSGAERLALKRGDVLADERLDIASARLDVRLDVRPAARRPLKNNERVRVFIGSAEHLARAVVLEPKGEIAPREGGLAQLVFKEPVLGLAGDRFVVRDETNRRTLGGGVVINPLGRRVRQPLESYRENLRTLGGAPGAASVSAILDLAGEFALTPFRLATLLNVPPAELEGALNDPAFVRISMGEEEGVATAARLKELGRLVVAALTNYHRANPLSPGIELEALRVLLPFKIAPRAFRALLDRLSDGLGFVREESLVRLGSHRVSLAAADRALGARIEEELARAGCQPPDLAQLAEAVRLEPAGMARLRALASALEREGKLVKVATDLYFAREPFEAARERLVGHLSANSEITAATYRDLLGASRKFAIALLDYFDHSGLTTRVGDVRRLRARAS